MSYTTKEGIDYADQKPLKTYDFIEIPEGATNGDVIKALFPNAKITEYGDCLVDFTYQTESQFFTLNWWNAPYKREGDAE